MESRKEKLVKAWEAGKTIQSKSSGKWKDFERQNQLDSPNWEYGRLENWRVKNGCKDCGVSLEDCDCLERTVDYNDLILSTTKKEYMESTTVETMNTETLKTYKRIKRSCAIFGIIFWIVAILFQMRGDDNSTNCAFCAGIGATFYTFTYFVIRRKIRLNDNN